MQSPPNHIFAMTPETLAAWFSDRGRPAFRARQVLEWVYKKGVATPAKMTNLPPADRELLEAEMTFESGAEVTRSNATDGTRKLLVEWADFGPPAEQTALLPLLNAGTGTGKQTECVMIPSLDSNDAGQPKRRTACISSQVGCPVGCRFCASGLDGLGGNLTAGRIVEQVWRLGQIPGVGRITNVVFMGMGEPLANFAPVVSAVRTLSAKWGPGIGARKITISTVGMHRAIERLADELDLPITLALSLHAPNDDLRRQLIPWAEFTSIDQLFAACDRWFDKTGREITLEYTLLRDVNDQPEHARELASVAKRLRANVNLIRFNEVDAVPYQRPRANDVRQFQTILRERGVNVHIRASRGRDIAAACGQLRREHAAAGG
ncbi:MAG: 23S rRNA (adenine(2503)-C(2))-methyltransferase RlmN [Planctomycetota bacterium]